MTHRIIAALLYLYPPRWRREYGEELQEVLQQRPLTLRGAADVAWQGLRQRWCEGGPVLAIGFVLLPAVAWGVVENLLHPRGYAACGYFLLHDARTLVPSVEMEFGGPNFYAIVLTACGLITRLRERVPLWRSGVAATQLAAVAGLPVLVLGALLMTGVVDLHVVTRAVKAAATAPGWTYTYCSEEGRIPSTLAIFAAPLLRLPQAFLYGLFGGVIASIVRDTFPPKERIST